jgi:hypothetical protein
MRESRGTRGQIGAGGPPLEAGQLRLQMTRQRLRQHSLPWVQSISCSDSPSALIRLSISDFSMMKGGASWMVSPP